MTWTTAAGSATWSFNWLVLSIIVGGPVALAAVLAIRAFAWGRRVPLAVRPAGSASAPAAADPRCGQCGYIVRGIASLTCPECGSDLREVGIDVGRAAAYRPRWWIVVGLAFVWSVGVFAAWQIVAEQVRRGTPSVVTATRSVAMNGPRSKAYAGVSFRAVGEHPTGSPAAADAGSATPAAVVTLFTGDGRAHKLTADLDKDTYQYVAADGRTVGPRPGLSAGGVVAWMADAGLNLQDPQVAAEAAEGDGHAPVPRPVRRRPVGDRVRVVVGDDLPPVHHRVRRLLRRRAPRRRPAAEAAVTLGGAGLWVLGVWWVARRFGPGRRPTAGR
jgi:hypothetical protein